MAEYIDLDQVIRFIKENGYVYASILENWPTVDAVEVVRCKDCKHFVFDMDLNHEEYPNEIEADGLCQITDKYCDMPHFCSYGERREGNGEG